MKVKSDFIVDILRARLVPDPDYGGNVLPVIRIYSEIKSHEEALAYQAALEELLESKDQDIRRFAVNVCLGFFNFYDVVSRPSFEEHRDEAQ